MQGPIKSFPPSKNVNDGVKQIEFLADKLKNVVMDFEKLRGFRVVALAIEILLTDTVIWLYFIYNGFTILKFKEYLSPIAKLTFWHNV